MHCRAAAYRLARHALVDLDSAEELHKQPLEWFIVKYYICYALLDRNLTFSE
jgi:hypothetical protein